MNEHYKGGTEDCCTNHLASQPTNVSTILNQWNTVSECLKFGQTWSKGSNKCWLKRLKTPHGIFCGLRFCSLNNVKAGIVISVICRWQLSTMFLETKKMAFQSSCWAMLVLSPVLLPYSAIPCHLTSEEWLNSVGTWIENKKQWSKPSRTEEQIFVTAWKYKLCAHSHILLNNKKSKLPLNERIGEKEVKREREEGQIFPECLGVEKPSGNAHCRSGKIPPSVKRVPLWLMSRVKDAAADKKTSFIKWKSSPNEENKMVEEKCYQWLLAMTDMFCLHSWGQYASQYQLLGIPHGERAVARRSCLWTFHWHMVDQYENRMLD